MDSGKRQYIALGSRLKGVPEVLTLGVKPNFFEYTPEERDLILNSSLILYPTLNYSQFLTTMGKKIFPNLETYIYADDKMKQTTLFNMQDIPHPRTKFYFHLHHKEILKDFSFPFIAKLPRRSSQGRGIFKIDSEDELERYLKLTSVAYIQEYMPHERDLRVILISHQVVLAYWRERPSDGFKTNLFQGGVINFDDIPEKGLKAAREYSKMCRFNDVGVDIIQKNGEYYLIEANMNYGRKGLIQKGMDLKVILRERLLAGELL
ncbi:MAG: ATP-grasp domain-containing protein [Deltaproteobacteria bacterium]|nr:ATP-grasp domain-containing protein [Deltaproteobacteria bacterium]